ncbi:MAG TPA: ABC transporter substrate-binding protein [Conexibacter sp.]|nr:ABC transporter substrate-binding protein [Conexibacter sp.]
MGGLVALAVLATGCGSSSGGSSSAPNGGTENVVETTPAATGELDHVTWDLPWGEPTTLDYAKADDYSPNAVVSNLCDKLRVMKPDFTYAPGLATAWRNPDPKTLVYTIRSGVRFWDGSPLTADDVVASMRRNLDPKAEPVYGTFYKNVASIEKTGPLQVTVHFKQPDELFNKQMATVAGSVAKASYMEEKGAKFGTPTGGVMCTGPFKLVKWESGSSITVERNDDYWDAQLQPKVRQLDFKFITDSSTLTSALQSGAIDGAYEVPVSSAATLEKSTSGTLYQGRSLAHILIHPIPADGPIADPRVREALSFAIDRAALARNVYGGRATPMRTIATSSVWGSSPARAIYQKAYDALPPATQDLARAKQLIEQAGRPSKPLVLAIAAGDQPSLQMATFVQADAKQIGLPITIRQLQPTDYSNVFYIPSARRGLDMIWTSGWWEGPDPLALMPALTDPDGTYNWIKYDNPKVTQLLTKAQSTLDESASAKAFVQAQAIYSPDVPTIPLLDQNELLYLNKGLTGAPASFSYLFSPWAAHLGKAG